MATKSMEGVVAGANEDGGGAAADANEDGGGVTATGAKGGAVAGANEDGGVAAGANEDSGGVTAAGAKGGAVAGANEDGGVAASANEDGGGVAAGAKGGVTAAGAKGSVTAAGAKGSVTAAGANEDGGVAADALVRLDNVFVRQGRRFVIHDVSLTVGERDFITVIGPNGAGKSTLLKCILGFFEPNKGRVTRRANLRIGYLPQKLIPDKVLPLSVGEFLRLRRARRQRAWDAVIEDTHLGEMLGQPLHTLSGGQLQRALLARALLGEPQLLVLDEPAQNLDIAGQREFYELLARIYKTREVSILMVSHDLHLVMSCTNLVVCLYHHICCSGRPHAVAQDPEFISLFGEETGRLMSVYHHSHDHSHADDEEAGGA